MAIEAPLDRAAILMALEAVLEDLLRLDRAQARHGALTILDIAEHPPDGSSSTDIESRIRNGILGWLRGYERR